MLRIAQKPHNFTHAITLAKYNWPLYLIAAAGVATGFGITFFSELNSYWKFAGTIVALIAAWYAAASFTAFHIMFDRSNLLSGEWMKRICSKSPKTWVQLSVCLEQTTLPLADIFPDSAGTDLDLFNPDVMSEPAINRARESSAARNCIRTKADSLPIADQQSDFTVITLAAHEVRDPSLRQKLFRALNRITRSEGSVVVVEHLRNFAAFLAFGPGIFHFYPRSEWLGLAEKSGLLIDQEFAITPFVHVFSFKPNKQT